MKTENIKKINLIYLLGYILGPIVICAICYVIGMAFFPKGTGAVILFMGPTLLSVLWWTLGGRILFKLNTKKFEKSLDEKGFERNHSFYGRGKLVIIDSNSGQIGLLFFWNPFNPYIVSASRVDKAWVDDGKRGSGFLEGSYRVRFIFVIDNNKISVDTFTSNQKFRMDSDYILTGISKADLMVKTIEEAKKVSK